MTPDRDSKWPISHGNDDWLEASPQTNQGMCYIHIIMKIPLSDCQQLYVSLNYDLQTPYYINDIVILLSIAIETMFFYQTQFYFENKYAKIMLVDS